MKAFVLPAIVGVLLVMPLLAGQTSATSSTPIPEEARKHFIMGTTLFKDAKSPDDYLQVEKEFKQAVELAPQWTDPRYNLALTEEAAGDYSGALADLKLYMQFKLADADARNAQDKIYMLEARQSKLDAGKKERDDAGRRENVEQATEELLAMTVGNGWRIAYCYVGTESSAAIARGCTLAETGGDNWHWGPYTTFSSVDRSSRYTATFDAGARAWLLDTANPTATLGATTQMDLRIKALGEICSGELGGFVTGNGTFFWGIVSKGNLIHQIWYEGLPDNNRVTFSCTRPLGFEGNALTPYSYARFVRQ